MLVEVQMPKETAGSSTPQGKPTLLIIEDDEDLALQMKWALGKDYFVCVAHDGPSAVKSFQENKPGIVTLDLGLPPSPGGVDEGFRVLSGLLDQDPSAKVIVITGRQEREYGLKAVSIGAYDYMTKPIDVEELKVVLKRALHLKQLEEEYKLLEAQVHTRWDEMIWSSKAMEQVWIKIQRVAPTDAGVLILGETGTGKELAARAIHGLSTRSKGPFVPIDCGAIPESLLESELFGHEKGAFTGAHTRRKGKLESANGGTLFLDEVGELPVKLQVKFLRFLQEQYFERLGGREPIKVDARVICATNRDLKKAVEEGLFREDLFFRISVVVIELPPLRERYGDIPLLAQAFLNKFRKEAPKNIKGFTSEAIRAMEAYDWPGNVRELENRVRRAVIMARGSRITAADLELPGPGGRGETLDLRLARENLEKELITRALEKSKGNISQAAQMLGVSRPTLYDLMEKLGMRSMRDSTAPFDEQS